MVNYLHLFAAIWPVEKTKRLAQYVCMYTYNSIDIYVYSMYLYI